MVSKTQKQLQGEQTRQQIINVAARLFIRKGFYGTSIADLAQAAGLTKGALYYHFENKDALFFAVVGAVRDAWQEAVVRDVLKAEDAPTRLAVLLDNHARLISGNEALCLVINSLAVEMDSTNPSFMAALQELYTEMTRFIERIVQKGQAAGQLRSDLDARLVAITIIGMLRGNSCAQILDRLGTTYAARMATLKQMVLDSLRP